MQFSMVIKGNETIEAKFQEALKRNPQVHMELVRVFGQAIMWAFQLNQADDVCIESFRGGRIPEEPVAIDPNVEKKVDN